MAPRADPHGAPFPRPSSGGSTEEAQAAIGVDVANKIVNYINAGASIGAVNFPQIGLPYGGPQTHRILSIHRNRPGVLRVRTFRLLLMFQKL
jgi:D-3-phosphoglycerate dehydrogenase